LFFLLTSPIGARSTPRSISSPRARSNAVGTVTLVANAATTTVMAGNCGAGSVALLSPLTAHAAAQLGNGTIFVSAVTNGSFTLTHANNAQTDRVFGFVAVG
jgi:hypothetical protein